MEPVVWATLYLGMSLLTVVTVCLCLAYFHINAVSFCRHLLCCKFSNCCCIFIRKREVVTVNSTAGVCEAERKKGVFSRVNSF